MGGGKNSVTSGSAVPATCRPAPVRRGPWRSRSPHALPAPEYRLAPRVGSVPTPRVGMQTVFPWRQGMPYGDQIASVKFSLAERLQSDAADREYTDILLCACNPTTSERITFFS